VVQVSDPARFAIGVGLRNCTAGIGRAIVDEEQLEIAAVLREDALDRLADIFGGVVEDRDHRNARVHAA
jgi:hypothetical protein